MRNNTAFLLSLLVLPLLSASPAFAADPPSDPLAGAFFPPELVMLAGERIGLTAEQRETLRMRIEKEKPRLEEVRQKVERENAALASLAKMKRVDETAISAQLDKLLDAEREAKHAHVSLLVAVKNVLTPEQLAKLSELGKGGAEKLAEEMRRRLEGKVAQVEQGMQKRAESGRDPAEIGQLMQEKFRPLMEAGKIPEAEAEVDRVLELLKKDE